MIQDTLAAVPAVVDSVSQQLGAQIGAQLSGVLALGLGAVVKVVMDATKKVSTRVDSAPGGAKALIAIAFSQVAVWASSLTGLAINPDLNALDTTVAGLVVSGVAMGVNAGLKAAGISFKKKS
jgi:hypothetical protein